MLLAGLGDPTATDARFVGISDGHLALWLGQGHLVRSNESLNDSAWQFAVAASDGITVTLYAGGKQVASSPIEQAGIVPILEMAPSPQPGAGDHHFGGK